MSMDWAEKKKDEMYFKWYEDTENKISMPDLIVEALRETREQAFEDAFNKTGEAEIKTLGYFECANKIEHENHKAEGWNDCRKAILAIKEKKEERVK